MATFTGQAAINNSFTGTAAADLFRWRATDLNNLDRAVGAGGVDAFQLVTGDVLADDALAGVSGIERFVLARAGSGITLANANFAGVLGGRILVIGGAGGDTVDGSKLTGANRIDVTAGAGTDVLKGGAGRDVFRFKAADLTITDTVQGGGGNDTLLLSTAGTITAGQLSNMTGVETIRLANGTNMIALGNGTVALGKTITVVGNRGSDTIDGSGLTGNRGIDITSGAGADVLKGGQGRDTFRFKAVDLTGDTIHGNGGQDQLRLANGGPLATGALPNMDGVEVIRLATTGNSIALENANFTGVAGAKITVIGGAGDNTVNAAGLTGVNRIDVTAGAEFDTLRGGAGADLFRFAYLNLKGDVIAGGAGSDTLLLTTAGGLPSNALRSMTGVERVLLAAGGNAITLENANFTGVAGAKIAVIGGAGVSADTVNASELTGANAIDVTAGAGLDVLRGGAGADVFRFAEADLDGDTVQGGGGIDTLLLTTVGGLGGTALANVTGVETIRFAAGGNALALVDANFAGVAGGIITVIGGAGPNLVDAAQLTSGRIDVTAGKDIDSLTGGESADVFHFAAADLTALDTVQGGAGYDTLFLTTAGTVGSLAGVGDFEQIVLAAGGNAITLTDGNTTAGGGSIRVRGSAGADTVNAAGFTAFFSINVTAGAGLDVLRGGAGSDDFRFGHDQLTAADTVEGGGGYDELRIETAGALAADALANVTGVEAIYLATGNTVKIADANFAVPLSDASNQITIRLTGESSSIDGSAVQTAANGLYIFDKGGIDAVVGGAGTDVLDLRGGVFVAGDTFDGGAGVDTILFVRSMDLLGTTISNVERLLVSASAAPTTVNISGENAAGFTRFGSEDSNGLTDTFNILLSEGSTTNLANLAMLSRDADDAINVISSGGATAVTLSGAITRFTGSGDSDTVGLLAIIGRYRTDVVINAAGGDDRIAWDDTVLRCILNGGAGTDTLVMPAGGTVDLESGTGPRFVIDFENVDASRSSAAVTLTGRDSFRSVLTGGSGGDTIIAGAAGAWITGGQGIDTLTGGAGGNRFFIRSTSEAQGDTISGAEGYDSIEVLGDTDLTTLTAISSIEALVLGARDAAGTPINANVTATMTGAQAEALTDVFGSAFATDSVETLAVQADKLDLNLSSLNFSNFAVGDRVLITGTGSDDTIVGSSQNDVIDGGGGNDVILGVDGDDVIGFYLSGNQFLNGGIGNDTVRLSNNTLFGGGASYTLTVSLAASSILVDAPGIAFSNTIGTFEFENADLSLSLGDAALVGNDFDNVLIGGSGLDTITGLQGADTLTGNGGGDSFVWNTKAEGGDTITDFVRGEDKLSFEGTNFTFSDTEFDVVTIAEIGSGELDLEFTDLLIIRQTLNSAAAVRNYVTNNSNDGLNGLFVVATNSAGSDVLYYTSNASSGGDNAFFHIADLGAGLDPALRA